MGNSPVVGGVDSQVRQRFRRLVLTVVVSLLEVMTIVPLYHITSSLDRCMYRRAERSILTLAQTPSARADSLPKVHQQENKWEKNLADEQ